MRVESSAVSMESTHQASASVKVVERVVTAARVGRGMAMRDSVRLSSVAEAALGRGEDSDLEHLTAKERVALLALEALLGKKFRVKQLRVGDGEGGGGGAPAMTQTRTVTRVEAQSESERTTFQARGVVTLTGGREISFAVNLAMEREYRSVAVTREVEVAATDPLVVNLRDGATARLTDAKVSFDLNSDGKLDEVSFVAAGSGFLVLDRNGDGVANDGTELFGPATGNGFVELAALDGDGNGWIDEGDAAFAQLRIWSSPAGGLQTLAAHGIGAIFAGAAAETPFALKGEGNALLGNIRATGVYLRENTGEVGTVQQVDLVVGEGEGGR